MANLKFKSSKSQWESLSVVRGPKGDNANITLNGSNATNASFYAPISSGLSGQILQSKGANENPVWVEHQMPTVNNAVLDIKKNGTSLGTFSANANENKTINIEVPVIEDSLASTDISKALSANQGKILNGKITDLTTTFNSWKTPHVTEIVSNQTKTAKIIINGYNNNGYLSHALRTKIGTGNEMSEYYGGIYIPNIEKYSVLFVELNCGGHTSGTNSQFSGGIVLWKGSNGAEDSDYQPGWQNYILPPSTNNYWKGCITKIIIVGNRTGAYCVGSVWNVYSGADFEWNAGFGDKGSTLKVIGILK